MLPDPLQRVPDPALHGAAGPLGRHPGAAGAAAEADRPAELGREELDLLACPGRARGVAEGLRLRERVAQILDRKSVV